MTPRTPAHSPKHFRNHQVVPSTWRKAQVLRAKFKVTQTILDTAELV